MGTDEPELLRDLRARLNPAQVELLEWLDEGSPAGRYEDYSHRISAQALQTRGLVKVSGHGPSWTAELTARGAAVLAQPAPSAVPPQPESHEVETAQRGSTQPPPPRPLSKTEQLIADLTAAGGVLRVPYWREEGQPDYRQRAIAAQRFGKVPPDKRLVMERVRGGELELRLEDLPEGFETAPQAVPVPARLTKPHPVAGRYRNDSDQHQVSRASLSRSVRIIHALVVEAERRGHKAASPNLPRHERNARSSAKDPVPHLAITVGNHTYLLSITEEKVLLRGVWEERRRANEEYRRQFPLYGSRERLRPYDSEATGQLTISLVASGYRREGRAASWSDRKSWTLEDKLPELLQELELRAVEDDERGAEERRQAEERRRKWELAMERAQERFLEAHRAKVLRAQLAARQEAKVMSAYLVELEEVHVDSPEWAEWIAWVREYIKRVDPLESAPSMPEEPEISREDLKLYLPSGMNPYGPERW
jgi:hypothetical protein